MVVENIHSDGKNVEVQTPQACSCGAANIVSNFSGPHDANTGGDLVEDASKNVMSGHSTTPNNITSMYRFHYLSRENTEEKENLASIPGVQSHRNARSCFAKRRGDF